MSDISTISRKMLQQLYRRDVNVDSQAENLLLKIGDEFINRVIELASDAAIARGAGAIEISDMKFVLDSYFGIKLPEYEVEEAKPPSRQTAARQRREAQVRKVYNTRNR